MCVRVYVLQAFVGIYVMYVRMSEIPSPKPVVDRLA